MTFPGSQDDSGTSEVLKLKRRFLKDRTVESSFFAKMELRKKKAQQVSMVVIKHLVISSFTGITSKTEGSQG